MTQERMNTPHPTALHDARAPRWRRLAPLSCAAAVIALAGCAAFHPEAVDRHQQGWRAGTVKRIGTADQLGERLKHDCRGEGTATADVFALVSYPHGNTWHFAIAPVAASAPVDVGQQVWVPTHSCPPVEPR